MNEWGELHDEEQTEERRALVKSERQALEAAFARLLSDEYIVRYLRRVAMAASFAPGRTPDQVAWAEGKRSLAVSILTLGGKYDGGSGREHD